MLISEMRSLLAICLIFVCFVDKSYGTFGEFLSNLPSEVASAFNNAWTSITMAIKKPVRIKRPGWGGKLKSTPSSTEHSTSLGTTHPTVEVKKYFLLYNSTTEPFIRSTTHISNRLTLPLLPSPKFKNLDEWRDMQKAHYAKRKQVTSPGPVIIMMDHPGLRKLSPDFWKPFQTTTTTVLLP